MDDYYELLGVDEDAPVDDIRGAYRDRKAAVDSSADDDAKAEVAKLNKAWNVLSDPYQRGRYDQQRAATDDDEYGDDEDDEYDDDDDDAPAAVSRSTRTADRAQRRRNARQPLVPTVKLPAGVRFPNMRQRLLAMGIDLLILIGLFLAGSVGVLPALEKAQHPEDYNAARELVDTTIPDAQEVTSDAKKEASAAKDNVEELTEQRAPDSEIEEAQQAQADADAAVRRAEAEEDRLEDQLAEHNKVLLPLQYLVTGLVFLAALVVLVAPMLFGRQTLGKEMQRVRVIRAAGSPARFLDVVRRYGVLVLAAFLLSFALGPTGALVAIFVATLWTRNPNQQGLHDRFAKTLVVTDDA